MMELEIQEKKENNLLNRMEVHFIVHHPNAPTPKRDNVREEISKALNIPKERVIVDKMQSSFGIHDSRGYAKVYPTKEDAMKVERDYLLKRNRLVDTQDKKGGEQPKEE